MLNSKNNVIVLVRDYRFFTMEIEDQAAEDSNASHFSGALFHKTCSTCQNLAKYCCPKCSAVSCSLACVKAHKEKDTCNGVRDKAAYVSTEKYQEKHMLSDYHFLEDINRTVSNANREKKNLGMLFSKPINLERLRREAFMRKTKLEILPMVFAKRKISTTYLRYSDRKIFWRMEWIFPLCNATHSDERVDEEELLGKCLDKYLIPGNFELEDEKLQFYQSVGHKGVSVLLKNEYITSNNLKYFVLRQNKSLRINFKGKRIVEFPTLLVVPKIHLSAYPVMES